MFSKFARPFAFNVERQRLLVECRLLAPISLVGNFLKAFRSLGEFAVPLEFRSLKVHVVVLVVDWLGSLKFF
jgi:hypothetical protein